MGYERYPRNTNSQGDYYGRQDVQDYGRDNGYSSARDYEAAGLIGPDRDRQAQGRNDYGGNRYARDDQDRGQYGYFAESGQRRYRRDAGSQDGYYQGSYASDGHRFTDDGDRGGNRRYGRPGAGGQRDDRSRMDRQQGYGRPPQDYDYDDRGLFARAGDEVRSWFGDRDAEQRRDFDTRYDERDDRSNRNRDDDYHSWRRDQISALDRDYDEYRQEHRSKFHTEFGSWREQRQTQRSALSKVNEHMDVVGSDGEHVGTVDKVRGDRIILTKSDQDAGGRHHSIPSRWIASVDDKVTISRTAEDAKSHWRDEERNQAFFNEGAEGQAKKSNDADDKGAHVLNRSFSGTY